MFLVRFLCWFFFFLGILPPSRNVTWQDYNFYLNVIKTTLPTIKLSSPFSYPYFQQKLGSNCLINEKHCRGLTCRGVSCSAVSCRAVSPAGLTTPVKLIIKHTQGLAPTSNMFLLVKNCNTKMRSLYHHNHSICQI